MSVPCADITIFVASSSGVVSSVACMGNVGVLIDADVFLMLCYHFFESDPVTGLVFIR